MNFWPRPTAARLCALLLLITLGECASNPPSNVLQGHCVSPSTTYYFAPGNLFCQPCPSTSVVDGTGQCSCGALGKSYATQFDANGNTKCVDCRSQSLARSAHFLPSFGQRCVKCGSAFDVMFDLRRANPTYPCDNSTLLTVKKTVAAATYDPLLGKCVCPVGYYLSERWGSTILLSQVCLRCIGVVHPTDPFLCVACTLPYVLIDVNGAPSCGCGPDYDTLLDGKCVARTRAQQLFATPSMNSLSTSITLPNLNNAGRDSTSLQSDFINALLPSAVTLCSVGNQTACNLLANLCVLSSYDVTSAACGRYLQLQNTTLCRGVDCEVPTNLPWLYYLRSSAIILQDPQLNVRVQLKVPLKFILVEYDWNGNWLGNTVVTNQLHLCESTGFKAAEFYITGSSRVTSCTLNLRHFLVAPRTRFYELYLKDGENLVDIPVLQEFSPTDLNPTNVLDPRVARDSAAASLVPNPGGYRRRFFLYDNIGGRASIGASTTSYIVVARRLHLLISLQPTQLSKIYKPLLIIQYASFFTETMYPQSDLHWNQLNQLRTNATSGPFTIPAATIARFTMDTSAQDRSLMIVLIVFCCLCFLSAWWRTYGWMRRQQDLLLGMEGFIRFFVYLCHHLSNCFILIVLITSAYIYIFFKYQYSVEYALPESSPYLFGMLYGAVAGKGVYILFKLFEQCNADVFVIDWERSKGQLVKEKKEAPVSMWRCTFIVNELNELQNRRAWHPLLTMIIILMFLEGLNYKSLSAAVPWPTFESLDSSPSHPILRIAISSFYWVIVTLVLYFLEYYIYFRFIEVHPLRAFVDLCSVSNISLFILVEPLWGFYIHGESIHAHADVSMEEFQENLKREAQGNLPTRGLGGQNLCQTFEVFIGPHLRNYLWACFASLFQEYQRALGGAAGPVQLGHHRRFFDFLTGGPGRTRTVTNETLAIRKDLNNHLIGVVREGEKTLTAKFPPHSYLNFPPNVMMMNGSLGGPNAGKDLFFLDEPEHYGEWTMGGLDFDLFLFYLFLYLVIDTSIQNTFASMIITYSVEILLSWYRAKEGQANLGTKTMFDDRFFI